MLVTILFDHEKEVNLKHKCIALEAIDAGQNRVASNP